MQRNLQQLNFNPRHIKIKLNRVTLFSITK